MKGRGKRYEAVDALKKWKTSIERHLLLRLFLIRRILSALSFNP